MINIELSILNCLFIGIISALGASFISKFGLKLKLIDLPNERSSHLSPTPRSGGIGILLASMFVSIFVIKDVWFSLIITAIGILGFLEDLRGISYKVRLLFQFCITLIAGIVFFGIPQSLLIWVLFVFLVLFIVGTTNIYNFMDGINGIAAITGVVAFGFIAYFSIYIINNNIVHVMSVGLLIACLFFLPWNFPKAKVFMGDVASLLLGFVFSLMVVILAKNFLDFICLIAFLFTFYADELITVCIRLKNRESLFRAHRKHFYQILANEYKIEHWKISISYGFVQIAIGFLALFLRKSGVFFVGGMLFCCFLGFVLLNLKIRKSLYNN